MGKLEKLVVLAVLFLVAVILGVSLNSDKGVADATESPLSVARGEPSGEKTPARKPRAARAAPENRSTLRQPRNRPVGPAGALSATVQSGAPGDTAPPPARVQPEPAVPPAVQAQPDPEVYILTRVGLEPSLTEDLMLYTWRQGDSFEQLAMTYYGSPSKIHRLRKANEGRSERDILVGQSILVPVLPGTTAEPAAAGEEGQPGWSGGSTYTVRAGDVLGTISQTVYGTSQSWRKIYDANRDQLADPNHLQVGVVLRIPE